MPTNEPLPENLPAWKFYGRPPLYFFTACLLNSAAAFCLLPAPRSEITDAPSPGKAYLFNLGFFALYLLLAPKFAPRYWTSTGAALGNAASVAVWTYYVWEFW